MRALESYLPVSARPGRFSTFPPGTPAGCVPCVCVCVFCARVRHHTLLARPASADCPFSRLRAGAEHTPGGVLHRAFCAPASARAAIAKLGSAVVCARLHQSVGCDRCSGAPLGEPVFYCCCCCHTFRISRCIGRKEVGRVEEAKTHCRWNTNNGNASSHFLHVLGSSSSTVPRSRQLLFALQEGRTARVAQHRTSSIVGIFGADPKIPTRNSFNNVKAETRDKAPAGGNGFFLIKGVHFSFARFGVPFCARLLVTLASIRCAKSA